MIRAKAISGALVLTADNESRAELAQAYALGGYPRAESYVAECLMDEMRFTRPELIGALTNAPILIPDEFYGYDDERGEYIADGARIFWFPDYAIRDPWEELRNRGRVEFTEASA